MTIIDQIKAAAAQPGVKVWIDEVLIRGAIDPSGVAQFGVIQGAHFVLGVEAPNLIGQPTRQLLPPFPAALVPTGDDSSMTELIGTLTVVQQQTIDAQAADLTAKAATIAERDTSLAARDAEVATLTATVAARDARIAELEAAAKAAAAAETSEPAPDDNA